MISDKIIDRITLTGERIAFGVSDCIFKNTTFAKGESPLKFSRNVELINCVFDWKYPLWHSDSIKIDGGVFNKMSRAGIWYTNNISMKNVSVDAPKEFRRCSDVEIENVTFSDASETLWNCFDVKIKNTRAKGDYLAMNSENLIIDSLVLDGNYPFDGCCNIEVRNSLLNSKDAFWNCRNVKVFNSRISGEYLCWNSADVYFENCIIESCQGLCYTDGLTLKNCTFVNTERSFEMCSKINADVHGLIDSVKNPLSGKIVADEIGELILDKTKINPDDTEIVCSHIHKTTSGISDRNMFENEI